jgi:hypothetical protein
LSLDTHELVKELTSVGFTEPQAEALTHTVGQLATKDDLAALAAVTATRVQVDQAVERLEHKIEILRRDLTIWLGSMIVAATAILWAARFFGHG